MRKIIKAAVLTLVLTIPAWAGEMGQPIAPPPPQGRSAEASTEPTKTGDIGCPIDATDIGMNLLQSLLTLL
ncbi:MAG: hypothetical protein JOZ52_02115 [Acidobacteria bacterium]|nr:hypothetical protein [Acidobacteriota bacterium]